MLPGEAREVVRQELGQNRGIGEDAQRAAPAGGVTAHLGLHAVQLGKQGLRVGKQRDTGWGQLDSARRTLEQRRLEPVFQQGDSATCCGRADVGRIGGLGQTV
jgi:hypothetical protein